MIEHNTATGETHVFCDICEKEITDTVYSLISGESLCKECFDNYYKALPVQEYIDENVKK